MGSICIRCTNEIRSKVPELNSTQTLSCTMHDEPIAVYNVNGGILYSLTKQFKNALQWIHTKLSV